MYKNMDMEQMVNALQKHLERRDIVGYAAARNTRILTDELMEFENIRDELVAKYGEAEVNEDGEPTGQISLKFDSPNFAQFAKEIDEFALIEHEPQLFKIKYTDVVGVLSGTEIMEIDWMLED